MPAGSPNVSASVNLTNEGARQVNAYLIDPAGQIAGFGSNYQLSAVTSKGAFKFASSTHLDVYAASAITGRWTLIVDFNDPFLSPTPGVGNEISQHFSGRIQLRSLVTARAQALPDSAGVTESGPVTVPVTITNHGKSPEDFFLDPRLDAEKTYRLIGHHTARVRVPLLNGEFPPTWMVPAETSQLAASAVSTIPMTFDFGPFADAGDPDVASFAPGMTGSRTPSLTVTSGAGALSPGLWSGAQAPSATDGFVKPDKAKGKATFTVRATTRTFDPGASSPVGDLWLETISAAARFNPLFTIKPGQSRTIDLKITPADDGTAGTVVHGTLYVDVFAAYNEFIFGGLTGSDVTAIPYKYKIG